MAHKTLVTYGGIDYTVTACIMRIRDGRWYYQLELHDLNANSVTVAEMEKVSLKEENR
jgi:hypothetical protein